MGELLTMDKKQTQSILLCALLALSVHDHIIFLLIVVQLILQVNFKAIYKKLGYTSAVCINILVTISLYLSFEGLLSVETSINIWSVAPAVLLIIVAMHRFWKSRIIIYDYLYASDYGIRDLDNKYRNTLTCLAIVDSVIFEELTFRAVIISSNPHAIPLAFAIGTAGFCLFHFHTSWSEGKFNIYDLAYQIVTSLLLATTYILTQSILIIFVLHLLQNGPELTVRLLRLLKTVDDDELS